MDNLSKVVKSFKKLPFSQKEIVFNALCRKVEGDNDGLAINRIEKALTRYLVKKFDTRSTRGINNALKTFSKTEKPFTRKDGDKVIKALETAYKGLGLVTSNRVKQDTKEVYIKNKEKFASRFSLSPVEKKLFFQGSTGKVEVKSFKWKNLQKSFRGNQELIKVATFSEADEIIYFNLARIEAIAIGDHFPKTLKPNVNSLIEKGVLAKGLNKKQAGEFLRLELTRRLGGKVSAVPPGIAKQGLNATTAYFEGLNATHITFARQFGQLQMMSEAGIQKYIWDSIIDNRTSLICVQMNGRIFEVETSVTLMNRIIDSKDVAELQNVAPFKRDLSEFGLKEGQKLDNSKVSAELQRAGVGLPAVHMRCRSEVNPF